MWPILRTVPLAGRRNSLAKLHLKLVAPSTKRTVTPTRRPNAELRAREHLTETEIEKLLKAAGTNRWGHRDGTIILVSYRHGPPASSSALRHVGPRDDA